MRLIERQKQILVALADAPAAGCSVRALSKEIGLAASSTHRLLQALAEVGMVAQRGEGRNYHLGSELLRLAGAYIQKIGLPELAVPYLDELASRTGLMAFSAAREGGSVICTGVRAPDETTNFYVRIGKVLPLHASSAAKALIYDVGPRRLKAMLKASLEHPYTARTHTTLDAVLADLRRGREAGYWECDEELEPDVYAVSAPILNGLGEPTISLTALCQLSRDRAGLDAVRSTLTEIAAKATRDIGTLLYAGRFVAAS